MLKFISRFNRRRRPSILNSLLFAPPPPYNPLPMKLHEVRTLFSGNHCASKMAENYAKASAISSEKVLFRVQVMKRKREKLKNLKEVSLYLFINADM